MAAAKWDFAAAGRAEDKQVVALLQPGVAGDQRHDLGFGHHGHGVEVEGVEGLAGRQAGLGEVALDAAAGALGDLVFSQGGEEAGGGPALFVGAFGEGGPDMFDRGQAQIAQQQPDAGGVDRIGGAHADAPSIGAVTVRTS